MGRTMTEKILVRGCGQKSVRPGEMEWWKVDGGMRVVILVARVE